MSEDYITFEFTEDGEVELPYWSTTEEEAEMHLQEYVELQRGRGRMEFIIARILKRVDASGKPIGDQRGEEKE